MNPYMLVGLFGVGFLIGMYADHEINLAGQVVAAYHKLAVAQTGEANIIKETQIITKDIRNDKDPCLARRVPSDINKRLH